MLFRRQTFALGIGFAQMIDCLFTITVGNQPFFKIQLIHTFADNAPHRYRRGFAQCNAQQTAARNKAETMFLTEKFQQGQILRIMLNLIKKDKRVLIGVHFDSCNRAEGEIKLLCSVQILKQLRTFIVFNKIHLNEIRIDLFAYLSNNKRFTNLTSTLDK